MSRIQAIAAARMLFRAGWTVRDISEALRAHPRAITALLKTRPF